jgi:hypothetical protein
LPPPKAAYPFAPAPGCSLWDPAYSRVPWRSTVEGTDEKTEPFRSSCFALTPAPLLYSLRGGPDPVRPAHGRRQPRRQKNRSTDKIYNRTGTMAGDVIRNLVGGKKWSNEKLDKKFGRNISSFIIKYR